VEPPKKAKENAVSQESKGIGISIVSFVVIGVVILLLLARMNSLLSGHSKADMSVAAITKRTAPPGRLNTSGQQVTLSGQPVAKAGGEGAPAAAPTQPAAEAGGGGARTGKQVFQAVCINCHGSGVAGAPKVGDKKAWAPRIAKGMDALMQSALHGVPGTAMVARGTCSDCSDQELRNAVEYMVSQSK
jgi:cytochrome c5